MLYAVSFVSTFLIATLLTGYFRRVGFKFGIVSEPRERDIHKKPIPRIGGLAIFVSFLLLSVIFIAKGADKHIVGIWIGGGIIAFSMLIDDLYGLKAWQKLFFQFVAVFALIVSGIGLDKITNPFGGSINLNSIYIPIFKYHGIVYHFSLISDLLTLIWIVGMMNIINFVDGVDGLAGGVSFIALITIFLLSIGLGDEQNQTAFLSLILAGATLGFLVWNFPSAKIFMGDCGAMFLGFILGALTLVTGGKLATVFLVLGFPIIDGLVVVGGRIRRGENPFTTPDKTHLHHRFLKAGFTPRQAIISMYAISIAFAWVALRSTTTNKIIAAVVLVILVFILTRWLNAKIRNTKHDPSRLRQAEAEIRNK